MFYFKAYTEENAENLTKRLEEMEDIEICYIDDPVEPVLMHKLAVLRNPFRYHTYLEKVSLTSSGSEQVSTNEQVRFSQTAQVAQFLDIVFAAHNPDNAEIYECKDISMKSIMSVVWDYCDIFDDKTVHAFANWCSRQGCEVTLSLGLSNKIIFLFLDPISFPFAWTLLSILA
ncbi:hypothetical protein DM01DRAFT_1320655 [Hesseltinella vesiculosa]|uniref:Uncharacterized protein n=1 Tax=Hesseltinella vesiculosa TaxID=101127 RepID=A0A1X2GL00_9FUNG|nr:hypothetical protein DM01DRAFT_1320655 [Hesseltinella vesiculosa]